MSVLLLNANALKIPLADKSVHCIVTSPPYYSLRDYGIPGQLGLEESPEAYIKNMVAVFRECHRVLRDDGTLWINIGDSYAGSGGAGGDYNEGGRREGQPRYEGTARKSFRRDRAETAPRFKSRGNKDADRFYDRLYSQGHDMAASNRKFDNLKPKDLIGIPWALAFALRADGWYLRSDIIWHKPNPMPESVTDRPTKAHEYLFLLSKSARYYYDADAIREAPVDSSIERLKYPFTMGEKGSAEKNGRSRWATGAIDGGKESFEFNPAGRNRRTVWTIATSPYAGAHFATYPPALVEPCIKAGSPKDGIVFDPFAGSGTTLQVARALGRHGIGTDLSLKYLRECARPRLELDAWEAWTQGIPVRDETLSDLPLFGGTL